MKVLISLSARYALTAGLLLSVAATPARAQNTGLTASTGTPESAPAAEGNDATASDASAAAAASADQDIVVTAQRREQSLQSVPQPVQALGGAQLIRSGITDLAATIQLVPSATTGSTISAGSNVFQIRGVAASETDGDPTVGYYLDNFAFQLPGRPFAPAADFYDLQRVEVLRGPSGTLYGLGSLGGTIKVLTNDPDLDAFHGAARVTGSATDGGQPNGSGDLMFNAPIIPGKLAVRGVVSYKIIGGYADALPSGERDANDAKTFTGRVKVLAKPTDDLTLKFTYWRNESNQNYSNRLTYFDPPALDQTFGIANSNYSIYTGDVEYNLGFATFQSTTGYIENTVVTNNGGNIPGIGRFVSIWPLKSTNFNEDARITSNGNGPFKYIAGVFYTNGKTVGGQNVSLPDYALPGVTGLETVNDGNELRSEAYAIYGEGTYSFFDRKVDLTLGGRYYHEKRRFDENSSITLLSLGITTPTVGTDRASHSTFNPRINLSVHVGDGLLYAEVAKGFRSGAITSTSIIAGANLALGTNFDNSSPPDTLWNYEGGVKWSVFDNAVRLSLSGYYFEWNDAQLELSPTLQTTVVPVGNVRGRGVDGEISWRTPLAGLNIDLSGNHNKTTIEDTIPQVAAGLPWLAPGRQLPGTARTTFAARASYVTPIGAGGLEFRASGRYSYRSRQQSVFDGRYAPWIGLGAARAGIGDQRFDLSVFSENIGNTRGPLSVPGGQYQIPFPRTVGLAFEYKF